MKMQSDELCQSVPKIDHWYLDASVFYKMGAQWVIYHKNGNSLFVSDTGYLHMSTKKKRGRHELRRCDSAE